MDYKRVLKLHYVNGFSGKEIEEAGGGSKSAVNDFLKRFRECEELTFPLPESVTNETINNILYKRPGVGKNEGFREFSCAELQDKLKRKGETLLRQWRKYNAVGMVDGKKPYSYRSYCSIYENWAKSENVTFHIQRTPGENMELDFAGQCLYISDPKVPDLKTKVTIFVATLSYSTYFYCEGLVRCDARSWTRACTNAVEFFGGVTPVVTPDNAKVAIIENKDFVEPSVNKDFQEWADHYGTTIAPAKVRGPRWKPNVEGHVKIVTMHILADMLEMKFFSIHELNSVLHERVIEENGKNFQDLDYSRRDKFEKEEKPALLPLPSNRFEYMEQQKVKVGQDFAFVFDTVHYTMPRKYIGKELWIKANDMKVFAYNEHGDLVRTHIRSHRPKDWVVEPTDMPEKYGDYGFWNVPYFQKKASAVGPETRKVIDHVMQSFPYAVQSFRSCVGILGFERRYGKKALEACCRAAVLEGRCNYSYIKNTIVDFVDGDVPEPPLQPEDIADDAIVSGRYKDDDSAYSLRRLLEKQKGGV